MMVAMAPFVVFLMSASASAALCDPELADTCPYSGSSDESGFIQTRTTVGHEQEEHTHDITTLGGKSGTMLNYTHQGKDKEDSAYKVIHFGRSYFISPKPDAGLKATFDDIAINNMWGSQESVSGLGSELTMTAPVRECLGQWIQKYNVQVFVDIPCGDANWQAHIPGLEHVTYKGYDIADRPIQRARQNNSKHTWMSFDQMDLTMEVPPVKPDIIMVRDVIQHLPLKKGRQMLLNAKRSGARYLAVSSFSDGGNVEVPAGAFYQDDVHAEPFNLPSRVEACRNYASVYPSDYLELIDLSTWNPSD